MLLRPAVRWPWVVLAAAAVFYAALLPRLDVGCYNDDAVYAAAAKSLLRGRYASLQLPAEPALNYFMPGLPLLLAPLVALCAPHWAWLKLVPLVCMLVSLFLLWRLSEGLEEGPRLAWLALCAANPTMAGLSGSVMTEPLFLTLALGSWLGLKRLLERETPSRIWSTSALLAWAALVRPEGIVLALGTGAALLSSRRGRLAARLMFPVLAVWGVWLGRNLLLTRSPSGYIDDWLPRLPLLAGPREAGLLARWFRTGSDWLSRDVLALPAGAPGIAAGACALAVAGTLRLRRQGGEDSRTLGLAIGLSAALYFLVHALWLLSEPRFLLPLVPGALLVLAAGADGLWRGRPWTRPALILGAAALALCTLREDGRLLARTRARSWEDRVPARTLAWVRDYAPRDGFVFTPLAPVVYLYTERHAAAFAGPREPRDREEFLYQLGRHAMTHVLTRPFRHLALETELDPRRPTLWSKAQRWADSWPEAFPLLYQDPEELTSVYAVAAGPRYVRAYELFLAALRDLEAGETSAGLRKLDESLAVRPLSAAWSAYGAAEFLRGRPAAAREKLGRALSLAPEHPLVLLNLARLEAQSRRRERARGYLLRALAAIRRTGDYEALRPEVQRVLAPLESTAR